MLEEALEIRRRAYPHIGRFWIALYAGCATLLLGMLVARPAVVVVVAAVMPIVSLWAGGEALVVARVSRGPAHWAALWLPLGLLVGGAVFHATIIFLERPSLDEANRLVQPFASRGWSWEAMTAGWMVSAFALLFFFCASWVGFLRHRAAFITIVWSDKPQSFLDFLEQALWGGEKPPPGVPQFGHSYLFMSIAIWCMIAIVMVWVYALTWLGIWIPDAVGGTLALALALTAYLLWLWWEWRQGPPEGLLEPVAES